MSKIRLGVCLVSLGLPLRRALQEAEHMSVGGVQIDAAGALSPQQLSQTGRRELRHLLRAHNLELAAVNCPLRHGLDVADHQEQRLDHIKQVMSLAFDLGPRLVTIQAGRIPETTDDPRAASISEALAALAGHGDRVGATLLLETGLENGDGLARFLNRFDTGSLAANFDPANLLMNGFNPYASARALQRGIRHAQAKDSRQAATNRSAQEVPLGHGDIDWMMLFEVLAEIDYQGWMIVKRESGSNRVAEIAAGVAFLRRLM